MTLLGILLGMLFATIFVGLIMINSWRMIYAVVAAIAFVLVGGVAGLSVDIYHERVYIEQYKATKATYEDSLNNPIISGLERIDLINTVVEENKELIRKQYLSDKWYGFAIPDEIKELEPIGLE